MIDKKIEEIIIEGLGFGELKDDVAEIAKRLKSLFKEYAMEIIGDDTEIDDTTEPGAFTANQLRAEQREKVGEI